MIRQELCCIEQSPEQISQRPGWDIRRSVLFEIGQKASFLGFCWKPTEAGQEQGLNSLFVIEERGIRDRDRPAMAFHQAPNDGEAKSGTAGRPIARRFQAIERLQHGLTLAFRNARARVIDGQAHNIAR